jgi:hypothetical protein
MIDLINSIVVIDLESRLQTYFGKLGAVIPEVIYFDSKLMCGSIFV